MKNKQKEGRHKCSICGRVRYARFMSLIRHPYDSSIVVRTRYGHSCYYCNDSADCKLKARHFYIY